VRNKKSGMRNFQYIFQSTISNIHGTSTPHLCLCVHDRYRTLIFLIFITSIFKILQVHILINRLKKFAFMSPFIPLVPLNFMFLPLNTSLGSYELNDSICLDHISYHLIIRPFLFNI